ncbi:MAG: type II toxin-antitoxin system HigB family toxin [Candidatus Electryonea clarkiae]|nr:type II toxin-antitoxin system HigB family toxin [Candidatus Electryonea clarkiae]MDP8285897.1 type II toxin-antitoxin system HigB family toxin [Candidatus Electryonea clarkiae]
MELHGAIVLQKFLNKHRTSVKDIRNFKRDVENAGWESPADIRKDYPNSLRQVNDRRFVFKFGHRFRIDSIISFKMGFVRVKRVGTHEECITGNSTNRSL